MKRTRSFAPRYVALVVGIVPFLVTVGLVGSGQAAVGSGRKAGGSGQKAVGRPEHPNTRTPGHLNTAKPVHFGRDVKPILAHACFACHAKGQAKGGLSLDSRERVLKGGKSGPALRPGKSGESELIRRVVSHDPRTVMPPAGRPLSAEQVAVLRAWIDQGAKWEELSAAERTRKAINIAPRKPVVPAGTGNPIDRILAVDFKKRGMVPRAIDDATFARRVYLDVVGVPPTPAELEKFLADPRSDRREQLVKTLLADGPRYADHWMTFWQDHLRDGIKDIGSTDVFRPITPWLRNALETNLSYDRMVTQLVTAEPPAELNETEQEKQDRLYKPGKDDASGFLRGQMSGLERPRGDQAWPVQAAQNIGQVFLGVQLKCATCHDSFIDGWTMADTWGFANLLAEKPLEAVRCELPTGKRPEPRFLFPEVGTIDPGAPRAERQQLLAKYLTSPQNGRFSRTMVNRLWARLLGTGLIERVDEMDGQPWNADLLDFLASDLVEHGYDLKRTLELILTSRAYQMPAVDYPAESKTAFQFRGPRLRRLTAEQFVDALYALLNRPGRAWTENGSRLMELLGRPDRRVVVTSRDSKASTMQALELLNGTALSDLIYTGDKQVQLTADNAAKELGKQPAQKGMNPHLAALAARPPDEVIAGLYTHALSRKPNARELQHARELLGDRPSAETVADLIWVLSMLPEFQLIR